MSKNAHIDFTGNVLTLGNHVVFSEGGAMMLIRGTITRFTPKLVEVEYHAVHGWAAKQGTLLKKMIISENLVKVG